MRVRSVRGVVGVRVGVGVEIVLSIVGRRVVLVGGGGKALVVSDLVLTLAGVVLIGIVVGAILRVVHQRTPGWRRR